MGYGQSMTHLSIKGKLNDQLSPVAAKDLNQCWRLSVHDFQNQRSVTALELAFSPRFDNTYL